MVRLAEIYPSREQNTDFNNDDQEGPYHSGEDEPLPTGRTMGRRGQPVGSSRHEPDEEDAIRGGSRAGRAREHVSREVVENFQLLRRRPQPTNEDVSDGNLPSPAGRPTAPQAQPSRRPRQFMIEDGANHVENQHPHPRSNLDSASNEPAPDPLSDHGESATAPSSTTNVTETQYTRDRDTETARNTHFNRGRHSTHATNPLNPPTPARISRAPGQLHLYIYSFSQYYGCPCPGLEPDVRLLSVIDCSHLPSRPRPSLGFHRNVTGENPRYAAYFFDHPYNEEFFRAEMRMVMDFVRAREGLRERWAILVGSLYGERASVVIAEEMGRVLRRRVGRGLVVRVEHLDL